VQPGSGQITHSLMTIGQLPVRAGLTKKFNMREKFPVTGLRQPMAPQSHHMSQMNPTTAAATHVSPSVIMNSNTASGKYLLALLLKNKLLLFITPCSR
jgi:hypothetical protein